MNLKQTGTIINYLDKLQIAIVKLDSELKLGDTILIDAEDPFDQTITSIQKEKQDIKQAKKGDKIGIKLEQKVKKNTKIYKINLAN